MPETLCCRPVFPSAILSSNALRKDLGQAVQGNQRNQETLRRKERARLSHPRETDHVCGCSGESPRVRQGPAAIPGWHLAGVQSIRACRLCREPDTGGSKATAQVAVHGVTPIPNRAGPPEGSADESTDPAPEPAR